MDKQTNFNAWSVIAAVIGLLIVQALWQQASMTGRSPTARFKSNLEQGRIDDLTITRGSKAIS